MRFVSFIIPTLGRESLNRTLQSLVDQTDPYWQALVIADSVPNWCLPQIDNRIYGMNLTRKEGNANCAGLVRDHGITNACGEWLGFVDDDDSLEPDYVKWLREESVGQDVVVFGMRCGPAGQVLPPGKELVCGYVGISFAVRSQFRREKGIWFSNYGAEDYQFLDNARRLGARIKVSDRVAYRVRH